MEERAVTTTHSERETRLAKAESTVNSYALGSLAVGLLPGPVLDLAALSALQLSMVSSLTKTYKLDFSPNIVKSLIGTLLEWTIARSVSQPLGTLLRAIPLIGQFAGAISLSGLYAASTYATGKVFIHHFDSGETLLTFEPAKMREHYEKEFKRELSQRRSPSPQKP